MTPAGYSALLGLCVDAIGSSDFASAMKYYAQAEATLAAIAVKSGNGKETMEWRQSLDAVKAAIDAAQAASSGSSDTQRRLCVSTTGYG